MAMMKMRALICVWFLVFKFFSLSVPYHLFPSCYLKYFFTTQTKSTTHQALLFPVVAIDWLQGIFTTINKVNINAAWKGQTHDKLPPSWSGDWKDSIWCENHLGSWSQNLGVLAHKQFLEVNILINKRKDISVISLLWVLTPCTFSFRDNTLGNFQINRNEHWLNVVVHVSFDKVQPSNCLHHCSLIVCHHDRPLVSKL